MDWYDAKQFLKGGIAIAVVGVVGWLLYESNRKYWEDAPERYVGFTLEEKMGYHPVAIDIPTRGDIVEVEKLLGEEYTRAELPSDDLTLTGDFSYWIEPDPSFVHRDEFFLYESPSHPRWHDVRRGTVTLRKEDPHADRR